jgi:hypothetical protein
VDRRIEMPLPDGTKLIMRQSVQIIESMFDSHQELDPKWDYKDKGGHYHVAVKRNRQVVHPTLVTVYEEDGYCGTCGDTHSDTDFIDHYECRFCHEEIKPGRIRVYDKPMQWMSAEEWTREGWVFVTNEEAQRMMIAGEAEAIQGGMAISGVKALIREHIITKERKEELIAQVAAYRESRRVS